MDVMILASCDLCITPPDFALLAVFETGLRENVLLIGGIA